MTAQEYGQWLANQRWEAETFLDEGYLLTHDSKYIAEGVMEDSEGRMLCTEDMHRSLQLAAEAPRLLRSVLRCCTFLEDKDMSPASKLMHVQLLLNEAAQRVSGYQELSAIDASVYHANTQNP